MRVRAVLFTVAALALVGAACSSSSGSDADGDVAATEAPDLTGGTAPTPSAAEPVPAEDEQAYIDSLIIGLTVGDEGQGQLVLTDAEAGCFAEKWVAIVTPEGFGAAGIRPAALVDASFDYRVANLTVEQATDTLGAFDECEVDLAASVQATLTLGMDELAATCVEENLDPELLEDLLLSAFSPQLDNQAAFQAIGVDLSEACPLN